ncbi:hypothetical protein NOVA_02785 [Nocardia nova]|uniref:hypothetical protein n=1 Tax=Nocardia nova TaxID=37330 RepID=UPI001C4925D4|nr:hypothetical protein [Nocardia nova]MBV7701688.1 hypothetical protein [Nocardia nova]
MTTLLFDAGPYSLGQTTTSGIGLRVAELSAALAHDFSVYIYSPVTEGHEPIDVGDAELVTDEADWPGLLTDADAVFFFDMPDPHRIEQARREGALIVSENAPPIEQLEYPRFRPGGVFDTDTYRELVDTYRFQLTHSDLFIARSHVERTTLIANLAGYGLLSPQDLARSRQLDHRITTIPIGYSTTTSPGAAARIPGAPGQGRGEVLWTGGLWTFMDPVAAVRAVATARADGVDVGLRFLHAAPHPDTDAVHAEVTSAANDLGIDDHVVLHTDPVRHDDRDRYLRHAAGLICLARPGIENQTCVRLRARDSRLYGLTLLVDPFGATATELAADGLAVAVDPADTDTIASYLAVLVSDRPPRSATPQEWAYEHTAEPLVAQLRQRLN